MNEVGLVSQAFCASCDRRATWRVPDGQEDRYALHASIWMDTHSDATGHRRFYLVSTDTDVVDLDKPPRSQHPAVDQLALSDSEEYSEFHVGGGDG